MVHSVLKQKQSSEEFSNETPCIDTPTSAQISQGSRSNGTSNPTAIWHPLSDSSGDPRETALALLAFVSDTELFALITSRVADAQPYAPPLYLTPFCIEGIHNFFLPQRSPAEALPDNPAAESPFAKIPKLRNEEGHLGGKVIGRVVKDRAANLLVSLATLLHFLSPKEMWHLIRARVMASQAPHEGVRWFLEFMASGGDGVPRGKQDLDRRKAKESKRQEPHKRERAEKRLALEIAKNKPQKTGDGSISRHRPEIAPTPAQNSGPPRQSPSGNAHIVDEIGAEEGEVLETSASTTQVVLPPLKKKRPRKGRGVKKA